MQCKGMRSKYKAKRSAKQLPSDVINALAHFFAFLGGKRKLIDPEKEVVTVVSCLTAADGSRNIRTLR